MTELGPIHYALYSARATLCGVALNALCSARRDEGWLPLDDYPYNPFNRPRCVECHNHPKLIFRILTTSL